MIQRSAILRSGGQGDEQASGRILAFDADQSLSDGAAAVATGFLFDSRNVPPWDTWLLFVEETPRTQGRWTAFDSYLLCWIPNELLALGERESMSIQSDACCGLMRYRRRFLTSGIERFGDLRIADLEQA